MKWCCPLRSVCYLVYSDMNTNRVCFSSLFANNNKNQSVRILSKTTQCSFNLRGCGQTADWNCSSIGSFLISRRACPQGSQEACLDMSPHCTRTDLQWHPTMEQARQEGGEGRERGRNYLRCPTNWAQSSECRFQNWLCSSRTRWGRSSAGKRGGIRNGVFKLWKWQ